MTHHGLTPANRSRRLTGPWVVRPALLGQFACSIHFDIWYRPEVLLKRISPGHAWSDRGRIRLGPAASWSPAVEIEQRDDDLVITAELPGLALEDIKVEVIGNVLVLQGERRRDRGPGGRTVGRSERRYGHFYREMCCRMAWTRSGCVLNLRMGRCASPFRP